MVTNLGVIWVFMIISFFAVAVIQFRIKSLFMAKACFVRNLSIYENITNIPILQ